MRIAALACLAATFVATDFSASHAAFRQYSTRLLDAGGGEFLHAFEPGPDGELFVEMWLDSLGVLGGVSGPDMVVAKFDPAGDLLWATPLAVYYSRPYPPVASCMAATPDGGVVLGGGFMDMVDFGLGRFLAQVEDAFLVKLDARGVTQWQRKYGGNGTQRITDVGVDRNGAVVITGSNNSVVDFGGINIRSNGFWDVFVASFTPNAEHRWSHGFGHSYDQQGRSVAIGDDNRIGIVIKINGGSIDFGGGPLFGMGEEDVVAAVLDENGVFVWQVHAAESWDERANDIAFDPQGNAIICGELTRELDLGGGPLVPPATVPLSGFVASYDTHGAHRWSYMIPDPLSSASTSVVADASGNVFAMGNNGGVVAFGRETLAPSIVHLLGFSPTGAPIAGIGFDFGPAKIRMDGQRDRVLMAATLFKTTDFGDGPVTPRISDPAFLTLGLREPAQVAITDFTAIAGKDGVEITWNLDAGEPLDRYWLYRRVDDSASAKIIASGSATAGLSSFLDRDVQPGHVQTYDLMVTTALGDEVHSPAAAITLPPAVTTLEQNAPNPFNPLTTFAYSLAAPADVSVVIYTPAGEVIARLEQGMQPAGRHTATWGGHNMHGEFVASGVYFYRLEGEGVPDIGARKMVLLK